MTNQEIEECKSLLKDKEFYWVKLNIYTRWQPALWDGTKERFKLLIGGYKHLRYILKVDRMFLKFNNTVGSCSVSNTGFITTITEKKDVPFTHTK